MELIVFKAIAKTAEELEMVQIAINSLFGSESSDKKTLSNAERAKRYRENKKNRDEKMAPCDKCDENVTNVTIEKEEEKEERENEKEEKEKRSKKEKEERVKEKEEREEEKPIDWKRAFGPEALRAETFSKHAGIKPLKTQYGKWQKDLKDLTEAHISNEIMIEAIKHLKSRNLTVSSPGSVLKTAQSLMAKNLQNLKEIDYLDGVEWDGMFEGM